MTSPATAPIPAHLSADGDDAVLVDTIEGCQVYAVRRRYGFDPRPAHVRARDPGPSFYWTPIIETTPEGGKTKTFSVRGGGGRRWEDTPFRAPAARDQCIAAIREELAYLRGRLARGEIIAL